MAEILLGNIKGENGATYTPALDSDGNLSWSNDKGLPNPPTVNIKGPQGPAGSGGGGGGSGDGIPKTGDRGVLGGYNTINSLTCNGETITIDATANDDTFLTLASGTTTLSIANGVENTVWVKQVFVNNEGGSIVCSLGQAWFFDNMSQSYTFGYGDLLVCVWYGIFGIVYTKNIM
jgi:hypothetical protein